MPASHEWHESVLPPSWQMVADAVQRAGIAGRFYLAGGTGLALQLGHRYSADLDLFSTEAFDPRGIRDALHGQEDFTVVQLAEHTLHAQLHRIQISFLHLPYAPLFGTRPFHGLAVADIRDIACMKLDALSSRGSRRDFVDLYFVLHQYPIADVLNWFSQKYSSVAPNRIHLAKALTYFADAESEPMPNMIERVDWGRVRTFFEDQTRRELRL